MRENGYNNVGEWLKSRPNSENIRKNPLNGAVVASPSPSE